MALAARSPRSRIPFITVFSEKRRLPGWLRGLLAVEPVTGSVRVRLGQDVIRLSDFQLSAGRFEVLMELRRRKELAGKLYAQHGALAIGLGMADGENEFHLFNAREWYDDKPNPD